MAIFDNFGKKVGKVANDAAAKSRELAEVARYSVAISDERAAIRLLYREIGEKYYRDLRTTNLDELKPICEKIDVCAGKISELEAKVRRIKGIRVCPACGETSERKARFCAACGKPLPVEESTETPGEARPEEQPADNAADITADAE